MKVKDTIVKTDVGTQAEKATGKISHHKRFSYDRLHLYLIKPSKYDDDGYVIRHWKGVLPSNTLACLYALSEDLRRRRSLGEDLKWRIYTMDETVQEIKVRKIIRSSRRAKTKTVVCLVGVQSNQFPRAADLAMEFRTAGIDVLLGGFHVSGIMATLPELTPELRHLKEAGVTLVGGEVEGHWEGILHDALTDALHPTYHLLMKPPEISSAPVPRMPENLLASYAVRRFSTLDCGRGCPYRCSFCTVINVQGRQMRFRSVDAIMERIRQDYLRHKIRFYFFTDDNFCRNKNWEELFDCLTRLREEQNIKITFMMQVDTQSYKIPRFIEKASRAGCSQVFIGMESLNAANLEAAGKNQNHIDNFKQLIDAYHEAGIVTHLSYIVGFPFDTEESVRADMAKLRDLGAEQASFFMLTPLPGSMDYKKMLAERTMLDADLNNYDSFHETFRHTHMRSGGWSRAYQAAWNGFYNVSAMKEILKKAQLERYWGIFLNFIWYKNAFQVEGGHPMIQGFIRLKGRLNRRRTFPVETRWVYFKRRLGDVRRTLAGWVKLALEMEEVWLATRRRSPLEEQVLQELMRLRTRASEWRHLRLSELQHLYLRAAEVLRCSRESSRIPHSGRCPEPAWTSRHPRLDQASPIYPIGLARGIWSSTRSCALRKGGWSSGARPLDIEIPSRLRLWIRKWNVFSDSLTFTRQPMTRFWRKILECLKRGRIDRIPYPTVAFMSFREGVLFSRFVFSVLNRVLVP